MKSLYDKFITYIQSQTAGATFASTAHAYRSFVTANKITGTRELAFFQYCVDRGEPLQRNEADGIFLRQDLSKKVCEHTRPIVKSELLQAVFQVDDVVSTGTHYDSLCVLRYVRLAPGLSRGAAIPLIKARIAVALRIAPSKVQFKFWCNTWTSSGGAPEYIEIPVKH